MVVKKHAKKKAAAKKSTTGALIEPEDRAAEEYVRELVAWYMLQGMDEATARRRAQDEMDCNPRKD